MANKNNIEEMLNTEKKETGINTGEAFATIERSKSTGRGQGEAGQAEQAERMAKGKTQGRRGCKAIRINMAITPDNHEFIRIMSRVNGKTMTAYTNDIIAQYREAHPDLYNQAKALIDSLEAASGASDN